MAKTRSKFNKRRVTGSRFPSHRKKRSFDKARQEGRCCLRYEGKKVVMVRGRGGNVKYRALRLSEGNFSWGSESVTRKSRIFDVVYNATSNELVKVKRLYKNTIVMVDPTPFKMWCQQKYGVELNMKLMS